MIALRTATVAVASFFCSLASAQPLPPPTTTPPTITPPVVGVSQRPRCVSYTVESDGDVRIMAPYYDATVSASTGALRYVDGTLSNGIRYPATGTEELSLTYSGVHLSPFPGHWNTSSYSAVGSVLSNRRISVVQAENAEGDTMIPNCAYVRVVSEGTLRPTSSFPSDVDELIVRRTYEFLQGENIYEQLELINPSVSNVRLTNVNWSITKSGNMAVAKGTENIVFEHMNYNFEDTNDSGHPLNLLDPNLSGRFDTGSTDTLTSSSWSRAWATISPLYFRQRLLSNATITVGGPFTAANAVDFNKYTVKTYPFYPGFGVFVVEQPSDLANSNKELKTDVDPTCGLGAIAVSGPTYFDFVTLTNYRALESYVGDLRDPSLYRARLDTSVRIAMHVLQRMTMPLDNGWPAQYGWSQYSCGSRFTHTAISLQYLTLIWSLLAFDRTPTGPLQNGTDMWAFYDQLQATYAYFTGPTTGANFVDDFNGQPMIAYTDGQKGQGVINTHSTAAHFISLMEDMSRLAGDTYNFNRWKNLRLAFHNGTKALYDAAYPATCPTEYDQSTHDSEVCQGSSDPFRFSFSCTPGAALNGHLGYNAYDPSYKEGNGHHYKGITLAGGAPGYIRNRESRLEWVDIIQADLVDGRPDCAGNQPAPGGYIGAAMRENPVVLAFLSSVAPTVDPNTWHPLRGVQGLLDAASLDEVLAFLQLTQQGSMQVGSVLFNTQNYIRIGDRWVRSNVPTAFDVTPGYWEQVIEANVPAVSRFSMSFTGAAPYYSASRRDDRIELMAASNFIGPTLTADPNFGTATVKRRAYSNGAWGAETLIGTVNRSTSNTTGSVFTLSVPSGGWKVKDLLIVELTKRPYAAPVVSRIGSAGCNGYTISVYPQDPIPVAVTSYTLTETSGATTTTTTSASRSFTFSNKANGTYTYRGQACNAAGCSLESSLLTVVVQMTPSAPGIVTLNQASGSNSYTISWGAASGCVAEYELFEATTSSFTNGVRINGPTASPFPVPIFPPPNHLFPTPATSFGINNKPIGTYYYRVRAKNASYTGSYSTLLNTSGQPRGVVVSNPPSSGPIVIPIP